MESAFPWKLKYQLHSSEFIAQELIIEVSIAYKKNNSTSNWASWTLYQLLIVFNY